MRTAIISYVISAAILGGTAMVGYAVAAEDAGPAAASEGIDAPAAPESDAPTLGETVKGIDAQAEISALSAAYKAGGWLALLGALVSICVRIFRPWAAGAVDWFATASGGYVFTASTAFLATLGAALATGTPISWGMAGAAVVAALGSLALTPGMDAKVQGRRPAVLR